MRTLPTNPSPLTTRRGEGVALPGTGRVGRIRRSTARSVCVTLTLLAVGAGTATACSSPAASPPTTTSEASAATGEPGGTGVGPAQRKAAIEAMVKNLGMDEAQQACTRDSSLADPELDRASSTNLDTFAHVLVVHADTCGGRPAIAKALSASVSPGSDPACLDKALLAMSVDQLSALVTGDPEARQTLVSQCAGTTTTKP